MYHTEKVDCNQEYVILLLCTLGAIKLVEHLAIPSVNYAPSNENFWVENMWSEFIMIGICKSYFFGCGDDANIQ